MEKHKSLGKKTKNKTDLLLILHYIISFNSL